MEEIGSETQPEDLDAGARAIGSFVRPYPISVNGKPVSIDFDAKSSIFRLVIKTDADPAARARGPTEIFLPSVHYGGMTARGSPPTTCKPGSEDTGISRLRTWHRGQATVNIVVEASSGGYEIEGNVLRWFHQRDAAMNEIGTQTIEIRRRGGPRAHAYNSVTQPFWRSLTDSIGRCVVC